MRLWWYDKGGETAVIRAETPEEALRFLSEGNRSHEWEREALACLREINPVGEAGVVCSASY